jgi:hypothetical protein
VGAVAKLFLYTRLHYWGSDLENSGVAKVFPIEARSMSPKKLCLSLSILRFQTCFPGVGRYETSLATRLEVLIQVIADGSFLFFVAI